MVRHGEPGYLNEEVAPGDLILSIDDVDVQQAPVTKLQTMLVGKRRSCIDIVPAILVIAHSWYRLGIYVQGIMVPLWMWLWKDVMNPQPIEYKSSDTRQSSRIVERRSKTQHYGTAFSHPTTVQNLALCSLSAM